MPRHNKQLRVYLEWEVSHTSDNPYKKFMDKYLCESLHLIKKNNPESGIRFTNVGGILGKKGEVRRIEVIFDQAVGDQGFFATNRPRRNFIQLTRALSDIDKLVSEIPPEGRLVTSYSTKHYKSPWVQVINKQQKITLVLRDEAVINNFVASDAIGYYFDGCENEPISTIRVAGEPHQVNKVSRELRLWQRRGKSAGFVGIHDALTHVMDTHPSSDYAIMLELQNGSKLCYGNGQRTRSPVYHSTIEQAKSEFTTLVPKYPDQKPLHKDLRFYDV